MSSRMVPLLIAAGVGVASGLYIWNQPLKQYADEKKNAGKPLVPADQLSPKATQEQAAAATAPQRRN